MEELFDGTPIELKPGMVLRYNKSRDKVIEVGYLLYLLPTLTGSGQVLEGYELELNNFGAGVAIRYTNTHIRTVTAVYMVAGGLFTLYDLVAIMDQQPSKQQLEYRGLHTVWERSEPVREMTVNEISKALGYKVKVVGEK